jgi:NADP-dependent 3-hydroxy acid dehydrogenase YdfG
MGGSGKRVVLISGASSGIRQACASHLIQKGYQVYGTNRRAQWPAENTMCEEGIPPKSFQLVPMDVTDDAYVE